MIVFGIVWIVGVWLLLLFGLGIAATIPFMRRREPDPPANPVEFGMPVEDVVFASRDGLELGGWWIAAQNTANSPVRGTVIMCPGQNGSMDKDLPQAQPLHAAGFNVLMFDFRGHGRSEGNVVTMGAFEQADLFGAMDYLAKTHGIERVGIFGLSMGAGVALMVAAQDKRVAALVADGAYPRLDGILAGYLRIQGIPGTLTRPLAWWVLRMGALRTRYQIYRANPADFAARLKAPALLIHGDQDPFVTPDEITTLAGQIPSQHELWRIPEAGHREAFAQQPAEYNQRVVAWFEAHLDQRI